MHLGKPDIELHGLFNAFVDDKQAKRHSLNYTCFSLHGLLFKKPARVLDTSQLLVICILTPSTLVPAT